MLPSRSCWGSLACHYECSALQLTQKGEATSLRVQCGTSQGKACSPLSPQASLHSSLMFYLFTHHQKKKTASLEILQATPKSAFSILLSWTFALPPDVEGSLVSCDLCRCEAGLSGFIQGHAQLQERSGPSKPQLTGWIRPRAGLGRAAVEHSQLLLDRLRISYTPGSALRGRLLVCSLLAWCQWLSTETMGEYNTM